MASTTMTVRLDTRLKAQLQKLAKVTHRTRSFLAVLAISEYLKVQEWQLEEIKKGIAEADANQLLDHSTIKQHWNKKRAKSLDKKRK